MGKKQNFSQKIEILIKNRNFGQKIASLVKNQYFPKKSQFLSKKKSNVQYTAIIQASFDKLGTFSNGVSTFWDIRCEKYGHIQFCKFLSFRFSIFLDLVIGSNKLHKAYLRAQSPSIDLFLNWIIFVMLKCFFKWC